MKRADLANNGFQFRASSAGNCPRLMDYQLQHGKKDSSFEQNLRMLMGTAMHPMIQEIVKDCYGDGFKGAERELKIPFVVGEETHYILGHPDGVIESEDMDVLYELKTVSDYTYKMITDMNGPLNSHYEQANLYAYALGKQEILFHYLNRNDGAYTFYMAPMDHGLALKTLDKFRQRVLNQRAGVMEERPYNDATATPCWFCERKDECYEGFTEEVNTFEGMPIPPSSELALSIITCDDAREIRLAADKDEKRYKANISQEMLSQGLNEVTFTTPHGKQYQCSIAVGKNNNPLVTIKTKGD